MIILIAFLTLFIYCIVRYITGLDIYPVFQAFIDHIVSPIWNSIIIPIWNFCYNYIILNIFRLARFLFWEKLYITLAVIFVIFVIYFLKKFFEKLCFEKEESKNNNVNKNNKEEVEIWANLGYSEEELEKQANLGYMEAQFLLGNMYYTGKGAVQNLEKAFYWYEKAASQEYKEAQFILGEMYNNGIYVEKESSVARFWYEKAANQGHETALKRLNELI